MFIIKEDKTRSINEGQYFVELTRNRGLEISNCDRLGYWCDKAHLEHFYDELNKVFSAEEQPKEENQDTITFDGKEYKFIESTLGYCCKNCALGELSNCPLFPGICSSDNRRDRREGYFKLIKPKNLELIPNEFYYLKIDNSSWVMQFKEFIDRDDNPICYFYMLKIHNNTLNSDDNCANNGWIKATSEQKLLLIYKVEKETDKVWNEDTKMFEDKPKEILVPENINTYTDNSLDNLITYSICLGGRKFGFIYNNGVLIDDKPKENIYKVIPIK